MPNCAVVNCKNMSKVVCRVRGDISYHRFPRDPNIKVKWIDATGNKDWFPTKHSTICSIHFKEDDYVSTKKRRLFENAYPTIQVVKTTSDEEVPQIRGKEPDTSLWRRKGSDIFKHIFPKIPDIKEKWIIATGRQNWFPTKTSTICSKHFSDNDFIIKKNGKKYVIDAAVPKIKVVYFHAKQSGQASSSSEPSSKKKKFDDGSECDEDSSDIEDDYDVWAKECARELRQMALDQQMLAKRAITYILMEGRLGLLNNSSVQVNNKFLDELSTQENASEGIAGYSSMAVSQDIGAPIGSSPTDVDIESSSVPYKTKAYPCVKSKSSKKTEVKKTADSISSSSFDNIGSSLVVTAHNTAVELSSTFMTTAFNKPGLSSVIGPGEIEAPDSPTSLVVKIEPFGDTNSGAQEIAAPVCLTPIYLKLEPSGDSNSLPSHASEVTERRSPTLVKSEANSPPSSPSFTITIKNENE